MLAQNASNSKISISVKNEHLKNVLKQINETSTYTFFYDEAVVVGSSKITLDVKNADVNKVLDELQKQTKLKYTLSGNTITVGKLQQAAQVASSTIASGEKVKYTGVIKDENEDTVIGASVTLKGNVGVGTITDIDGRFEIAASSGTMLEISCIGFQSQELKLGASTTLAITLKEDTQLLEEVVVVGFGSQKKVNLTGSVATVSSDAFEGRPVQNATMMLQGLVPGLNISQGVGELDKGANINIRGTATIGQGSSGTPLILIDGMEGDLNLINPQDIENISVLKDAAASSIYGSRAPFGVILVTTKSGKSGRYTINYNNSMRWNTPTKRPRTVDSYRFATYFNDAAQNSKGTGHFSPERMQRIRDYMDGKITTVNIPDPNNPSVWADPYDHANANIDWWDAIYDKWSFTQEHTASMSGGSEKLQMYASLNYLDTDGMIKEAKDTYKRYATNLRVNSQITEKIHVDYNIKFTRTNYDRPSQMGGIARFGYQTWPVLPTHDDNGYLFSNATPLAGIREGGRDKTQIDAVSQQAKLILRPFKGFEVVGQVNYSFRNIRNHWDIQKLFNYNVAGEPIPNNSSTEVKESSTYSDYMNPNVYGTYDLNINDTHNFKFMGGFQSETHNGNNFDALRYGVIIPGMDVIKGTSGTDGSGNSVPPVVNGARDKWAVVGFFGRLNYNFKERYLAEVNMRYDGTSRFRSNKRWKTSPSASVGWNMAQEDFWKEIEPLIHTLKLRGSYGVLSNQNTIGLYPTYLTMPIGTSDGEWIVNGKKPNTADAPAILNSAMTWETVKVMNVGVDVGLLSNRLNFGFDWYQRKTEDMIGPAPEMPAILGTPVPRANNTDLRTRGWEINLSWRDQINKDWSYFTNFTLSDDQTVITSYPNENYSLDKISESDAEKKQYYNNYKLGDIWGFETLGIAKTQEEMDNHLASLPNGGQNSFGSLWGAGDIMYKDLNGDGVINTGSNTLGDPGDRKVIGNSNPRFKFGLTLGGQWKQFDLSMFFQGVMKRDYWANEWNFWGYGGYLWRSTAYEEHMDYFRNDADHFMGENLNSYYPRPRDGTSQNLQTQTRYLQNAAYIRLKNLNIGYTLDNKILAKTGLSKVRVFFAGENLWTGTKLKKMLDPEALGYGNANMGYPLSKTISFGVSVTL